VRGRGHQVFVVLVVLTVAAAVLGGLLLIGTPGEERARRLDARRVENLQGIAAAVDLYWTRLGRLPDSLATLEAVPGLEFDAADPDTHQAYGYRVLDSGRYELCAQFTQTSADSRPVPQRDFWAHGAGTQCFALEPKLVER
jgi:hypothetical protein